MKTIKLFKQAVCLIGLVTMIISCDDSNDDVINSDAGSENTSKIISKYIVAFQDVATGKNEAPELLIDLPSLKSLTEGEINAEGKGIPLTGWSFANSIGNIVFAASYGGENKSTAYQLDSIGSLKKVVDFKFVDDPDNFSIIDDNTLLAVDTNFGANFEEKIPISISDITFYVIDAKTGKLNQRTSIPLDNKLDASDMFKSSYVPWVTGMILRDGNLFVSYHKLAIDASFNQITPEKSNVAVLSYPDFELIKIIEDDRTSPIGVNGCGTGLVKTENGDIYSFSSSSTGANIPSSKPSGILRIKNGTSDFDKDYFFNVETTANGGKIFWMDYIGNGKALARMVVNDDVPAWSIYGEQGPYLRFAIIDIINKTVTNVTGIPDHASRYSAPVYLEDGKAYVSARVGGTPVTPGQGDRTNGETHIYSIDINTANAIKGARVNGLSIKGIFKIDNQN